MKMNRIVSMIAAAGLLMGATVAQASSVGPLPTTSAGPHAAQINGGLATGVNDLYEVRFIAIDGANIHPRATMWLHPGRYVLTVSIIARNAPATLIRRTRDEPGYNTIEVVVEAGKTYEIRAKYDRSNRRSPYSVVLHRVTE